MNENEKIEVKRALSLLKAGYHLFTLINKKEEHFFYQKEKVGSNRTAATYSIYFIDSRGKVVSDMGRIIADRSEAENQKRVYRVGFNLKSMQFDNKATYYLMIVDESGIQQPVRIEFQIDIAFAVDEFNFFA